MWEVWARKPESLGLQPRSAIYKLETKLSCYASASAIIIFIVLQRYCLSSICCNKYTINWVAYKPQKSMLFLSVLEAGSPRSRYQHGQVLSGCRLLTSHCVLTWQKELWRALWGLFYKSTHLIRGLPWWLSGKEPACNCRRLRFDPWVGKIPWRRESSPVFLLGKSHRQRRLVGYIVQGIARVRQDLVTEQKQHQIPFMGVLLS